MNESRMLAVVATVAALCLAVALTGVSANAKPHIWKVPATEHSQFGTALGLAWDDSRKNDGPSLIGTYFSANRPRGTGYLQRGYLVGRILRLELSGPDEQRTTTLAGNDQAGRGGEGDGELATDVPLGRPSNPLVRSNGDILFIEGSRLKAWLRVISHETGRIATVLGSDRWVPYKDGQSGQLTPVALTQNGVGDLFVVGRRASETPEANEATEIWRLTLRAGIWRADPIVGGGRLALDVKFQSGRDVRLPNVRGIIARSDGDLVSPVEVFATGEVAYALLEARAKNEGGFEVRARPKTVLEQGNFKTWFTRLVEADDHALFGMRASGLWKISLDLTEVRNVIGGGHMSAAPSSGVDSFIPVATDIALSPDGGLFFITPTNGVFYTEENARHQSYSELLDRALVDHAAGRAELARRFVSDLRITAMTPKTTYADFYNACFRSSPGQTGRTRIASTRLAHLPLELVDLLGGCVQHNVAIHALTRLRARMALDAIQTTDRYSPLRQYIDFSRP